MSGNNERPLTIGILGAGAVAQNYHLPVLALHDDVRVAWICDKDAERAAQLARASGVPASYGRLEQCPNVDILLVAIPVGFRWPAIEMAFARGWDVFCEKPFAASLADHDRILEAAARLGRQVGVGLMRRFYDGTLACKRLVKTQIFGPVREIWAAEGGRMRGTGREAGWYQSDRAAAGGGAMIEAGSHLVDQSFWILGARSFVLRDYWQDIYAQIDYEARALAVLEDGRGHPIRAAFAISKARDIFNGIVLVFDACEVHLGLTPDSMPEVWDPRGGRVGRLSHPPGVATGGKTFGAFFTEWLRFLEQVRSRQTSDVSAASARLSTAFIDACYAAPAGAGDRLELLVDRR